MKNKLLLFAFIIAYSLNTYSTTIQPFPNSSYTENFPANATTSSPAAAIAILNTSNSPIEIKFNLVSVNFVNSWSQIKLCNNNYCHYGNFPASGTLGIISQSAYGVMEPRICANNIPGTGYLKYYVYDVNDSINGYTLTWTFNATGTLGIEKQITDYDFSVYPNPAINYIIITKESTTPVKISICNLLGQNVYCAKLDEIDNKIDVSNLADGAYFISIMDENKKSIKTKKIVVSKK